LLTEKKKQEYGENGPKGKFCTLLDKKKKHFSTKTFLQLLPYGILNLFFNFCKKNQAFLFNYID